MEGHILGSAARTQARGLRREAAEGHAFRKRVLRSARDAFSGGSEAQRQRLEPADEGRFGPRGLAREFDRLDPVEQHFE